MFDPVQAPSLRHAFELVNAAILEADLRLEHQILDRARHQHFAGTRFRGDARADVKRETDHVSPAHFVFARVQPHPDLQPQRAHCLADCGRATDPGLIDKTLARNEGQCLPMYNRPRRNLRRGNG